MDHSTHKLFLISIVCCLTLFACKEKKDQFNQPAIETSLSSLSGFEFSKLLVRKFSEQGIRYPKPDIINVLKKQIIEDYLLQSVYDHYASQNNLFVKKEDLDAKIESIRSTYPDRQGFEISINEAGLNLSEFKQNVKNRLTRKLVRENLLKDFKADISDKTIKTYYEEHKSDFQTGKQLRLKQIVVEHEEEALKIQNLLDQLKNKSFEDLAKKYSLTPEKIDGGDLGWVEIDSFPAFKKAEQTANGHISPIIKSPNGYHIFKVTDRRSAKTQSLKDAQSEISALLKDHAQAKFMSKWLQEQSKHLNAKINHDLISKIVVNRPSTY